MKIKHLLCVISEFAWIYAWKLNSRISKMKPVNLKVLVVS